MYMPPDLTIPATSAISQLETTTAALYIDKNFISTEATVKNNAIPIEAIDRIITAVATNNEIKTNEIINEYNVDSLAKLRFDFKTENNITYKNINLFFLACRSGSITMVQELINNPNIDINELTYCDSGTNGRTALIIASGNHVEIIKLLLEHNADITIKDKNGTDASQYSLETGANNIDRCYEIQNLLHNHKKKFNITSDCLDIIKQTTLADYRITLFNNNQDFIITFFYKDDNNNITNIESRTNKMVIQKFLDSFKPYVIHDITKPPVTDNIISCLIKSCEAANISIDCTRPEGDPTMEEGLNVTVCINEEQQIKILGEHSINFEDQIPSASDHYNEQSNLIDYMMPAVAIYYNKKLIEINKSDVIKSMYDIVLYCLQDFTLAKHSFSEACNKLPDNLSDIENYPEYQQLEAIDELIYIAITLSMGSIRTIPESTIANWK